ncbi:MAG: hypothetical protein UT50_C0019G0005 [Candidatus Moranbacteria bacterium GW2011_GWA2_39_41]|nr:MAG: hypothetical protein UT50_C0019G0005 [Candidatus Moranbacteria bacterium GW2011_GWA2_39_41]
MQKYSLITILLTTTVLLSGCSSTPKADAPVKVPVSNIMKSMDGGRNWEAKDKTQDKVNLASVDVISMAVNPYDGKNVFVGTLKNGILKTDDGGENWSLLKFPAEKVYGLAIDNVNSRIVYASGVWNGRGKIFKSIDGGFEWTEIYTAPSDGPLVISLTMSKKKSDVLYATTSDSQVIKSVDAGNSWKNIFVSPSPVLKIAIDTANENLLYMNLQAGGVLRSIDGGITNEDVARDINRGISFVETDPYHANWIYAGGQIGLLRSKDAGKKWETLKTLGDSKTFPVKAVAINPANSNEIIYGAAQATYKSIDGGVNWTTFQLQTKNMVSLLQYSSTESNVLYMGLRK